MMKRTSVTFLLLILVCTAWATSENDLTKKAPGEKPRRY
jgi:hypothetical protein